MVVNMRNNQCLKLHVIMKLKKLKTYNISLILCIANVKYIHYKVMLLNYSIKNYTLNFLINFLN
jgi:hypothetical protein